MNTILTTLYAVNVIAILTWCLWAIAERNVSDLIAALIVLIITMGLIYLEFRERNLK